MVIDSQRACFDEASGTVRATMMNIATIMKSWRAIEAVIIEYLHRLQYTGLFSVDCKCDPRDGCLKVLDINARGRGQPLDNHMQHQSYLSSVSGCIKEPCAYSS